MREVEPPPEPIKSAVVDMGNHWSLLDQVKAECEKAGLAGVVILVEEGSGDYRKKLETFLRERLNINTEPWRMEKPFLVLESPKAKQLFDQVLRAGFKVEIFGVKL